MTEAVETSELTEQKTEELRQERGKLLEAEQKLRDEQTRLEKEREAALDSDDGSVLEAALAGKPLKKNSALRKAMDRLEELPHQLYSVKRRYLQASIELFEFELADLEEERVSLGQAAHAAHDRLLEAQEEAAHTQAIAAGASADRDEKIRSIGSLRDQLASHEQSKPSNDLFLERLRSHKVWRWGPE